MVLDGWSPALATDFTDERDVVQFPFSLHHEGFHLSFTRVSRPRKARPGPFGGHMPDDSTTECSDNCALFATLEETTKQDAHPFPRLDAFPVAKACFLFHDLSVDSADVLTKTQQEVRLRSKVLVIYAHLVKFFIRGDGFGNEGFSTAVHVVERFFPSAEGFQTFPNARDVESER